MEYLIGLYLVISLFGAGMYSQHMIEDGYKIREFWYLSILAIATVPILLLGSLIWYRLGGLWLRDYFRFWYRARFTDYYTGGSQEWVDHVERNWGKEHRAWRFLKKKYNY